MATLIAAMGIIKTRPRSRCDAAEAFKPAAQGFFVVALTSKRVGAGKVMIDMWRDWFQQFVPAMVVHVFEGLSNRFLTM